MPRIRRAVCVLPIVVALFAFGCAHRPGGRTFTRTIPKCPGFIISSPPVTVDEKGGTFPLGGGSQITFAPGAVATPTTFNFSALTVDGDRVAGVRISGPTLGDFDEPVVLRIGYAGCPDIVLHEKQKLSIAIVQSGHPSSIGGAKSTQGKFVEAYLVHFSDYAIAL